ncbi:MAG: twin-arginine translocation signal domain-containing protein, partial [Deltaproteobacteria bacterium]|nr:twin-arginine translocation signal domain-containing protein [Deltaproteobacteria bacterium]
MLQRRTFLKLSALGIASMGMAGGAEASSRRVGIKHHRIAWPISKPIKVAHLTDLHVGWGTP